MDTKLTRLVKLLQVRTLDGDIEWEETARPGVYQAAFPKYAVSISTRRNRDDPEETDYFVTIHNEEGKAVEQKSDIDLRGQGLSEAYPLMQEIYDTARRQALGTDKVLEDLLSYLGEERNETHDQ